MELALNLAWLVLSLTLVIKSHKQVRLGNRRAFAVVAMICLIAFLFPIISITDDLNGGTLLAETTKQKRWQLAGELAALITAAFAAICVQVKEQYALLSKQTAPARRPFIIHSSRRPPPPLG